MKRIPCLPAALKAHDSVLKVHITDSEFDPPASMTRKGHRRNHTRRLLIQHSDLELASSKLSSTPPKHFLTSPEYTDLNSFPSTTIESEGSWSEDTAMLLRSEQTTVAITDSESPRSFNDFLTDLQRSMTAILKEEQRLAKRQFTRRSIAKKYLVKLILQRSSKGFGMPPSFSGPKVASPSERQMQWP